MMTREDVIALLRRFIAEHDTQGEAARKIGVSPGYLTDVLKGNREPGPSILSYFDIELVKVYRQKK